MGGQWFPPGILLGVHNSTSGCVNGSGHRHGNFSQYFQNLNKNSNLPEIRLMKELWVEFCEVPCRASTVQQNFLLHMAIECD